MYSGVPQNAVRGEQVRVRLTWEARTVGLFGLGHVELTKPKVAQCNVPCVIKENVLWLEVTVL